MPTRKKAEGYRGAAEIEAEIRLWLEWRHGQREGFSRNYVRSVLRNEMDRLRAVRHWGWA